jgi:hypothetical protein
MLNQEDAFSSEVFSSVRSAYKRGVLHTIRGKSKEAQAALQAAQKHAEQRMARSRIAVAREHELLRAREHAELAAAAEAAQAKA